jgi:putative ABC transport system substrate-binding protein
VNRRDFLGAVTLGSLSGPLVAGAQPAGKVPRVGLLAPGSATGDPRPREAFREGLRSRGWTEGRSLVIEYRYAEGRPERLPALAAELVGLKVDVVVAATALAVVAARNASTTTPIVMVAVADPVGRGLVTSLARPGGNVTGVAYGVGTETFGKGLELLREAFPRIRRVAILSNPDAPTQSLTVTSLQNVARSLRLELQVLGARGPADFDGAFSAMDQGGAEALLVVTDATYLLPGVAARLADLATRSRLPSMHSQRAAVEAGGLMSYGPSIVALFSRAAYLVDKILKGARPADLPVEQPTTFELVISQKAAKALGVRMPPSLVARADDVIE